MPTKSLPKPGTAAVADETFLGELLKKLKIPNQILLKILRDRMLAEQRTQAHDLWSMLLLRGESEAANVASRMGDVVSAEGVGRLLGLTKSGVHKAKTDNRLLGFHLPSGQGDLFPVFQIEKGQVRPWITPLLRSVGNGLPAVHFLGVPRRSLEGASYYELLRMGDDPAVITSLLERAESLGDASASPLLAQEAAPLEVAGAIA